MAGIGNSGGDISVELSRHAKQVYLSTRRGAWVFPRMRSGGYPGDLLKYRRFWSIVPKWFKESMGRRAANQRFDHKKFGLQPNHGISQQHPMVNDDLPLRMMTGKLVVKPNIKLIKETSKLLTFAYCSTRNSIGFCLSFEYCNLLRFKNAPIQKLLFPE